MRYGRPSCSRDLQSEQPGRKTAHHMMPVTGDINRTGFHCFENIQIRYAVTYKIIVSPLSM
jgi:hypothetical protein